MPLRELFVRAGFSGDAAIGGLRAVDRAADTTKGKLVTVGVQFDKLGTQMSKVGKGFMTRFTLPLVGAGIAGAKTMIDMEDAASGALKTFDGTEEEFREMLSTLDELAATELPVPRKELYGIAEIAGQLGVKGSEDIASFTETIGKIGRVTNLSYEEGAASLARFANIMGMNIDEVERLGSVVVHLDSNLATTASEIVGFATRLAGAGRQAGMTEAQVMGIAGALSSVGITAEAGGTAVSKVILDMVSSIHEGGSQLELYGAIAGTTSEKFAEAFEEDAAGALGMFLAGLDELQDLGMDVTSIIESLGFADFRVADALRRAAGSSELFNQAIMAGSKAWEENIALTDTFTKRTDNIMGRIDIVKNKVSRSFELIGLSLKKNIISGIDVVGGIADWFNELDDAQRGAVVRAGVFIATIGPTIFIVGKLVQGISWLAGGLVTLGVFASRAGFAFSAVAGGAATLGEGLTFLLGPTGLVLLAIGALIVAGVLLYRNWDTVKKKFGTAIEFIREKVKPWGTYVSGIIENVGVVIEALGITIEGLGPTLEVFKQLFGAVLWFIGSTVVNVFGTILDIVGGALRVLSGLIDFIVGIFTLDWEKAWMGIGDIFGGVWDVIKAIALGVGNFVVDLLNTIIKSINSVLGIKIPDWVPGIGGKLLGIEIPLIPTFETDAVPALDIGRKPKTEVKLPPWDIDGPIPQLSTYGLGSPYLDNIKPDNANNKDVAYSEVFAPEINVTVDGGRDIAEQVPNIKREVEKAMMPFMEKYWATMQMKRPTMTGVSGN